ncbi:MAG: DUF455 family protein [Polyangiaceae bacterium]
MLTVLHETQRELRGRNVPTAMLYGRVAERIPVGVEELQRVLQRLGAGRTARRSTRPGTLLDATTRASDERSHRHRQRGAAPAGARHRRALDVDFIRCDDAEQKLAPPPPPPRWEADGGEAPPPRRLLAPGRPPAWTITARSPKTPRAGALVSAVRRAQLFHSFLHHELQAAELMGWALLAFPETPRDFRAGLLRILGDELRHCRMYRAHLAELGHAVGDFAVRDWFWARVPSVRTPLSFVATMGIGFEGGNLDHSARFAERLRGAGDVRGAELSERVGAEEVAHVRFAVRWFREWAGTADFARWVAELPAPLSPMVMRGRPLDAGAGARRAERGVHRGADAVGGRAGRPWRAGAARGHAGAVSSARRAGGEGAGDGRPAAARAWVLNFDADEELAAPRRYAPSAAVRALRGPGRASGRCWPRATCSSMTRPRRTATA